MIKTIFTYLLCRNSYHADSNLWNVTKAIFRLNHPTPLSNADISWVTTDIKIVNILAFLLLLWRLSAIKSIPSHIQLSSLLYPKLVLSHSVHHSVPTHFCLSYLPTLIGVITHHLENCSPHDIRPRLIQLKIVKDFLECFFSMFILAITTYPNKINTII